MQASVPNPTISLNDWQHWLERFGQPQALLEIGAILLTGLLAWLIVRNLRSTFTTTATEDDVRESVLFGAHAFDGVLFPLLWLCFTFLLRFAVSRTTTEIWPFALAMPILLALLLIRIGVKTLRIVFAQSVWIKTVENSISWLIWGGMVLWVTGFLPLLFEQLDDIHWKIGNSNISVGAMLQGALTVGLVVLVALWLSSLLEKRLLRSATGGALSLRKAISNISRALLLFFGVIFALSLAGIDLTALSVFGGALGVGIGLGLQKLAANYVSGFVILAERSIRIGDSVKVDGFEGRIVDINARYTLIRALGGTEAIVPNEMMITQKVENHSLNDPNFRTTTTICVGYESDVALVSKLLLEAAASQPRILKEPAPTASLVSFGADGLQFELGYWIADREKGLVVLQSEVNKQILTLLRAHQIEIPFPQRVVHWQTSSDLAVPQAVPAKQS